VGTQLNASAISEPLLRRVLGDIQAALQVGPVTLCLHDDLDQERGRLTLTTRSDAEQAGACSKSGCLACREDVAQQGFDLPVAGGRFRRAVSLPVEDRGERFGVLILDLREGETLEPWQNRLLETLAGHLGTALKLHLNLREGRRLSLYEERAILARELHDSLAQSLSYLKIQAARLDNALDEGDNARAGGVLDELREGISSAYRQLRELLTTFRLKMDDRGLSGALEATVQEFRARGRLVIDLQDRLPPNLLSPNEEIHVLQIVREALSNVTRHAGARQAQVRLALDQSGSGVEVEVADDGRGIGPAPERRHHYGLTIMRERAQTLDGTLTIDQPPGGGTRVSLRFRHRASLESEPSRILSAGATRAG
jgi:two-component system nitrate/nitrite sensor histidine kinase NarX